MKKFFKSILFFSTLVLCGFAQAQPQKPKVLEFQGMSFTQSENRILWFLNKAKYMGTFDEVGYTFQNLESSYIYLLNESMEPYEMGCIKTGSLPSINYFYGIGDKMVYYYPETGELLNLMEIPFNIDDLSVMHVEGNGQHSSWQIRTQVGDVLLKLPLFGHSSENGVNKLYVLIEDGKYATSCFFCVESNNKRPTSTVYDFRANLNIVLNSRQWMKLKKKLKNIQPLSSDNDFVVTAELEGMKELINF